MARQPLLSVNRDRPALVRSTATARLWQRKGRCIRVKLACKMTRGPPRLHSPAFSRPSGVNRERRRPLGTRRNAHLARGQTRKLTIKTGFARKVGRESRGIERGSSLALGPVLIQTLRNNARSSLRAWRSETATHLHPLCSHPQRALLLRTPLRALHRCGCGETKPRRTQSLYCPRQRRHCCRAKRARVEDGKERKRK